MANSTTKPRPKKPNGDFPLFRHRNGLWCKKIRQRHVYFGSIANDPKGVAALARYREQAGDLHAGRTPQEKDGDGLTVADLCNRFLTSKQHLLNTGEIVERTFRTYFDSCKHLVKAFGKHRLVDDLDAKDFAALREYLAKGRGPVSLGNEIGRIRSVFKLGHDEGLYDKVPRYGASFRKPSAKTLRKVRAANGERMLEAFEVRRILEAAPQPMKAFVLLGVNCAFGQSDIANLTVATVEKAIESGWMSFPRPKTGVERRCPLWAETREALQEAVVGRPEPKDAADADQAFLTSFGGRWVRHDYDALCAKFTALLKRLGLKRPKVSFYTLRHVHATVGSRSKDQVALNTIMGHADHTMAAVYRERVDDDRLVAVTACIHAWLFEDSLE